MPLQASHFFCLERLSRHYLPPVAASGEKDESGVKDDDCTGTVKRAHLGRELGEDEVGRRRMT